MGVASQASTPLPAPLRAAPLLALLQKIFAAAVAAQAQAVPQPQQMHRPPLHGQKIASPRLPDRRPQTRARLAQAPRAHCRPGRHPTTPPKATLWQLPVRPRQPTRPSVAPEREGERRVASTGGWEARSVKRGRQAHRDARGAAGLARRAEGGRRVASSGGRPARRDKRR